jgi:hypothetical protein
MSRFLYPSGDKVKLGDRIRYHSDPGGVEFVIIRRPAIHQEIGSSTNFLEAV